MGHVRHAQLPGLTALLRAGAKREECGSEPGLSKWLIAQAQTAANRPPTAIEEDPPTQAAAPLPAQSASQPVDAATSRPEDWMDDSKLWQPGNVFDVQDPDAGEDEFFRVYVPAEYDPNKAWPVIFYYHALNEKPSTAAIRNATDAKRYIVVGMSYSKPGTDGSESFTGDVRIFHHVLTRLKEHLNVDEKKLYVSGFSKGGFTSCGLMRLLSPELAGAVVLGAGIGNRDGDWPDLTGKHIFIGVGEKDQYRDDATGPHFTRLGATVTLELWPDLDHAVGDLAGLRQWLIAQAGLADSVGPPDQVAGTVDADSSKLAAKPTPAPATQPADRSDPGRDANADPSAEQPAEQHISAIHIWTAAALVVVLLALVIRALTNRRSNVR